MRCPQLVRNSVITIVMTFLMVPLMTSAQTLEEVNQSKVFTIGYVIDQTPFSASLSGGPTGYSIELCRRVANETKTTLGMPNLAIKYHETSIDEGLRLVANGQIDILCGAVTNTLKRQESVSFSLPIFVGGVGALLRSDASTRLRGLMEGVEPEYRPHWRASYAQILQQHTFSAIAGSAENSWMMDSIGEFKLNVATSDVKDYGEGIAQVMDHKSDVFFADRAMLITALTAKGLSTEDVYVAGRGFTNAPIALVMSHGNEELRLVADRTLSRLYRSGEILNIYESFFGEPEESARVLFRMNALPE